MTSPTSKQKWVMMLAGVAMTSIKIYRRKDVEEYRSTKSDVWEESACRI